MSEDRHPRLTSCGLDTWNPFLAPSALLVVTCYFFFHALIFFVSIQFLANAIFIPSLAALVLPSLREFLVFNDFDFLETMKGEVEEIPKILSSYQVRLFLIEHRMIVLIRL